MRILFTFVGGHGHFEPLVPIARAAEAAGHTVAFGCALSMVSTVKAADFTVFAMGMGASSPPERIALRPLDSEREDRDLRDRFARRAAQYRVPRTIALCTEWQPNVLVCDETDFGAVVAAERLGLPFATVLVIAAGSFVRTELVVSHGGSGSVIGALAHGLPSVLIPIGADQPLNAGRCANLGVAQVLDAMEVTPESVRAAASMVLDDAAYRRNAERLRDEIAALPEPAHAVGLLERLAAEGRPLYSA